jgi:hypothetical protein
MAATPLVGKQLVRSAYRLLMQDSSMIVLLFVGGLFSGLAFLLVAVPASMLHGGSITASGTDVVALLAYAIAVLASTFVSVFFLGAVVAAAMMRADGMDPDVRSALGVAWSRRVPLLAWAGVSTVVGMLLRSLERSGLAGSIVRLLAGMAWGVATWFAIPVIIAEGTMPMATIRRSSQILTSRFGSNVRATVRLGLTWGLAMFGTLALAMLGGWLLLTSAPRAYAMHNLGVLLVVVGGIAFVVVSAMWSALSAYLRTVLYRYAVGLATPGIDASELPPLVQAQAPLPAQSPYPFT